MQNLIENLVWTLLHHQSNKRSINQITMGLLFLQLMNYTERVQVGEQYFEQEMLLGVYRYIEEHYREGSLSELAEELHYDFYTLSRMIRRLTGKNYTELVQNKRLTQAAYLLETTGLSVADIGERGEIRKCVNKKGFNTCGDCKELNSCPIVSAVFLYATNAKENLLFR